MAMAEDIYCTEDVLLKLSSYGNYWESVLKELYISDVLGIRCTELPSIKKK